MSSTRLVPVCVLLLLVLGGLPVHAQPSCTWNTDFIPPGVVGVVNSIAVFDDGSGPALYLGGKFRTFPDGDARNLARWDGSTWSTIGEANAEVRVLFVWDDGEGAALYAGGDFTAVGGASASHLARWDGASWSEVGGGVGGEVRALGTWQNGNNSGLYVGGDFTQAGGVPTNRIARWDGSSWSSLGTGVNDTVRAVREFQGDLYVGGEFTTAGGSAAAGIARWNGSSWADLRGGLVGGSAECRDLLVWDDGNGSSLFVGGHYFEVDGVETEFARWDGSAWHAVGVPGAGFAQALLVFDDGSGTALYAGSHAQSPSEGGDTRYIKRWDGQSWEPVGYGMDGPVRDLALFDAGNGPQLFAAGTFTGADDSAAMGIATWDGGEWRAVSPGDGLPQRAEAFIVHDDGSGEAVFVGGRFSYAGSHRVEGVARWNGNDWSAVGAGFNGDVRAFAIHQGDLIAGGSFLSGIVGSELSHVARWDGTAWHTLAGGVGAAEAQGDVNGLAIHGGDLYVGGRFTTTGAFPGEPASRVARWDGTAWSPLGSGVNDIVHALTSFDDGSGAALYVAGEFSIAGGTSVNHIARWNGSSWSAVGAGLDGPVYALHVYDDGTGPALYAGGAFVESNGQTMRFIARWNGSTWSAVGGGMGAAVYAMTNYDDGTGPVLVAGGNFVLAGGSLAERVASWDGSAWTEIGGGVTDPVLFTSVRGVGAWHRPASRELFVGGTFVQAGETLSTRVAIWGCAAAPHLDTFRVDPLRHFVAPGFRRIFTVTALDQFGNPWPTDGLVWTVDAGEIDPTGLYTAPPEPGIATVTATLDGQSAGATVTTVDPSGFLRGDFTGDGQVLLEDVIRLLRFQYSGGAQPAYREAADTDGDEIVFIDDPVFLLEALFMEGTPPPPILGALHPYDEHSQVVKP